MITQTVRTCQRSFKIIQLPANGSKGLVRVTIAGKVTDYAYDVLRVDPECGDCALELKKLDPETYPPYHVLVGHDGSTVCDCMGYLRWADQTGRCKHCDLAVPLIRSTTRMIAERDHAESVAAVEQSKLAVRQQSEQTLVIETADRKPVATIECTTGLTDDHVRAANYIAANPAELAEPERAEANVVQLPDTTLVIPEPVFTCRRQSNRIQIFDPAGQERLVIDCTAGINIQHERVAAWLIREPRYIRPECFAGIRTSLQQIPGTTVRLI